MLHINQQFISDQLIPTLSQILTDIGSTETKNGKSLKTLLDKAPVDEIMRREFTRDYFQQTQPVWRPFMKQGEEQYQLELLNLLDEYFKLKITLAGSSEKVRQSLLPSKERIYGENDELTRQIRHMTLWMVNRIEQNEARQTIGESLTDNQEEDLLNGKIKVIYINRQAITVTQQQLEKLEGESFEVMVQPGLFSAMAQSNPDQTMFTKSQLFADFERSESQAMENVLLSAGLDVISTSGKDQGGFITAQITDVNQQRLTVKINTNLENSSSAKFEFTFTDDPAKESFYLSQKDVPGKFVVNGQRKSAAQVAEDIVSPEASGPREKTTRAIPTVPNAIPTIPKTVGSLPINLESGEPKEQPGQNGQPMLNSEHRLSSPHISITGQIPQRRIIRGRPVGITTSPLLGRPGRFRPRLPKGRRPLVERPQTAGSNQQPTPMETKQELAARPAVTPRPTETRTRRRKTSGVMGKVAAGAGIGATTLGPGALIAANLLGNTDATDAISFVLHCVGLTCVA